MAKQPCPKCASEIDLAVQVVCGYCGWINPVRPGEHSFAASAPKETHWRKATCEEAECWRFLQGFRVPLEPANDKPIRGGTSMKSTVEWMRAEKSMGRLAFTETRIGDGIVDFVFPPGHQCFEGHALPIGASIIKPHLLHVTASGFRRHEKGADFNEDMNETNLQVSRGRG